MGANRTFVKEMKRDGIRLWIMIEGEFHAIYYYHENFPLPVDKELVLTLEQAENVCHDYLYPECKKEEKIAV